MKFISLVVLVLFVLAAAGVGAVEKSWCSECGEKAGFFGFFKMIFSKGDYCMKEKCESLGDCTFYDVNLLGTGKCREMTQQEKAESICSKCGGTVPVNLITGYQVGVPGAVEVVIVVGDDEDEDACNKEKCESISFCEFHPDTKKCKYKGFGYTMEVTSEDVKTTADSDKPNLYLSSFGIRPDYSSRYAGRTRTGIYGTEKVLGNDLFLELNKDGSVVTFKSRNGEGNQGIDGFSVPFEVINRGFPTFEKYKIKLEELYESRWKQVGGSITLELTTGLTGSLYIEDVYLDVGDNKFRLVLDSENKIDESNENDNIYPFSLYINQLPTSEPLPSQQLSKLSMLTPLQEMELLSEAEEECTDSDKTEEYPNGKNYYLKGTAYGPNTNPIYNNVNLPDNCYGPDGALTEFYCENGQTTYDYYTCPYGCEGGRCLTEAEAEEEPSAEMQESCKALGGVICKGCCKNVIFATGEEPKTYTLDEGEKKHLQLTVRPMKLHWIL